MSRTLDQNRDMRNDSVTGAKEPSGYSNMKLGRAQRDKIDPTKLKKLDDQYNNTKLKPKQRAQYLRDVYYSTS